MRVDSRSLTQWRAARYAVWQKPSIWRNAAPHIYAFARATPAEPVVVRAVDRTWSLLSLPASLDDDINLALPMPTVFGYDYVPADQPHLLEVWCAKAR